MIKNKKEFYAVEIVRGKEVYLEDYEMVNGEGYILNTTKNLMSNNIYVVAGPEDDKVLNDIKNDAFSEEPRIVKVSFELRVEEV